MYIRRKVFSLMEDVDGDLRYFSTTDYDLDLEDRLFAKKDKDDYVVVDKTGRIVGTTAGVALGAGAGAGLAYTEAGRNFINKHFDGAIGGVKKWAEEGPENWLKLEKEKYKIKNPGKELSGDDLKKLEKKMERNVKIRKNLAKAGAVAIPVAALGTAGYLAGKSSDRNFSKKDDDYVVVDKTGRIVGTTAGAALGAGAGAGLAYTEAGRNFINKHFDGAIGGVKKWAEEGPENWLKLEKEKYKIKNPGKELSGDDLKKLEKKMERNVKIRKNLAKAGAVAIPVAALGTAGYLAGRSSDR